MRAIRTAIPGLTIWDLPVHGDNRGWFKENWQRAKMVAAGMPDFGPVQNNVSFNDAAGTTRGIHAEPWDKYISVASGRIFGAWVDLRDGPTFGTVFTAELDPSRAVFVPQGVGNGVSDARAEHCLHLPGQRSLLAGRRLHVGAIRRDETLAIDVADSVGAGRTLREGPGPGPADRRHPDPAAQDVGDRRRRSTRPRAA